MKCSPVNVFFHRQLMEKINLWLTVKSSLNQCCSKFRLWFGFRLRLRTLICRFRLPPLQTQGPSDSRFDLESWQHWPLPLLISYFILCRMMPSSSIFHFLLLCASCIQAAPQYVVNSSVPSAPIFLSSSCWCRVIIPLLFCKLSCPFPFHFNYIFDFLFFEKCQRFLLLSQHWPKLT